MIFFIFIYLSDEQFFNSIVKIMNYQRKKAIIEKIENVNKDD